VSSFDLLEHTADLGIRARGADTGEALGAAIRGLSSILVGDDAARPRERRDLDLAATDREALVVALLQECLYLFEVHGWIACGADLHIDSASHLTGALLGEHLDEARHADGLAVKAITWHQLAVAEHPGYVEVTVFVDC